MGKISDKAGPGRTRGCLKLGTPLGDGLFMVEKREKPATELIYIPGHPTRQGKETPNGSLIQTFIHKHVTLFHLSVYMPDDPQQGKRRDGKCLDRTPRSLAQVSLDFNQFTTFRMITKVISVANNEAHGAKRTAYRLFVLVVTFVIV
jgi:hypothetical protein